MAETLPNGTVIPQGPDLINANGVQAMRDMGASVDAQLANRSLLDHNHDDRYYTEAEVDAKLAGKAAASHTHDDRYYTESEMDAMLAGKAATGHTHSTSQITGLSGALTAAGDTAKWGSVSDKPSVFPPDLAPTELADENLNTVTGDGNYVKRLTPGGGLNYPRSISGLLRVVSRAAGVMRWQWYTTFTGNDAYYRAWYNGTWYEWKRYALTGEVNTALAGKANQSELTSGLAGKSDTGHTHAATDIQGFTAEVEARVSAAMAGMDTAYDVATANGFVGNEVEWLASLKGDQGIEGPYGGTVVTDPQVASYITTDTETRTALDAGYRNSVSVLEYGATGDGVTDDTAAFTAAMGSGRPVTVPPGEYVVTQATASQPVDLEIQHGAVIVHKRLGPAIHVTGTEYPLVPLTGDVSAGATAITAPGHGVEPGGWVRLTSDRLYEQAQGHTTVGELVQVHAVDGDVITPRVPVQGGPYLVADNAGVGPIDMVDGVRVHGRGELRGDFAVGKSQTGLQVSYATNVSVEGIRSRGFDWRHFAPVNCSGVRVVGVTFDWTHTIGSGYGVAPMNACQDLVVDGCYFTDVRHAFTTTNGLTQGGPCRRMTVQNCSIWYTRPHEGGQQGDALDTHRSAEDINFLNNTIVGSSGIGINHECRNGKIAGNTIIDAGFHAISVHNETDEIGSIEIRDNRIIRPAQVGVRVIANSGGGTVPTEGVFITGNYVEDAQGAQSIRVGMDSYPVTRGVIITGNIAKGGPTDFIRTWNTEQVVERDNLAISGGSTITITGRAT